MCQTALSSFIRFLGGASLQVPFDEASVWTENAEYVRKALDIPNVTVLRVEDEGASSLSVCLPFGLARYSASDSLHRFCASALSLGLLFVVQAWLRRTPPTGPRRWCPWSPRCTPTLLNICVGSFCSVPYFSPWSRRPAAVAAHASARSPGPAV